VISERVSKLFIQTIIIYRSSIKNVAAYLAVTNIKKDQVSTHASRMARFAVSAIQVKTFELFS